MALVETKIIDQITVVENGAVLYREAMRILTDGKQVAQTYHRNTLNPGHDLTGIPENVVAICNVVWKPEVIAAYQAQVAEQAAKYAAPAEPALEQPAEATQATDPAA